MTVSMAAKHARGKIPTDKIFGANAAAVRAAAEYGAQHVVNATIGSILDDDGKFVSLPTVAKVFRELPMPEIGNYAPIAGKPDYLKASIDIAFADNRPAGYIKAVATAGGTGAIHHTVWNYSEAGDAILTADWFWAPYRTICEDAQRRLENFSLFDEKNQFNVRSLETKINELLHKQDNLIVILNTPANNPTGYSVSDEEWEQVICVLKASAQSTGKNIILLVDVAYIDYAGEKNECRRFMRKLGGLPENILTIFAVSMSKSYTMYGQRTGAMICVSSSAAVAEEFSNINQVTSRATWTSINRGCMELLAVIHKDEALEREVEQERAGYYHMIRSRADVFLQEAQQANLPVLPYRAGFFLVVPTEKPDEVCQKLYDDRIFAVPLARAVRIAVCAVSKENLMGMAGKIAKARAAVQAK